MTLRTRGLFLSWLVLASLAVPAAPAHASVPDWVLPALRYMVQNDHLERASFDPNEPMRRSAFKRLMHSVFGRGYQRTQGLVRSGEVARVLVRVTGRAPIARQVANSTSPGGWDPGITRMAGFEITAREMGLRFNRPTSQDAYKRGSRRPMLQADIIWSVWRARTAPSTWGADALSRFSLQNYNAPRRRVVRFALSLVGTSYIWGGEWPTRTPAGYPYGAQPAGGFDCSGFVWYVLRSKEVSWSPNRPYRGWPLAQRSSRDMARAAPRRIPYRDLRPGDIMFFSPDGRGAKPRTVYHAGIYLGRGWMIHSSGSRAGVSLSEVAKGTFWHGQFTWGRRVIGN